jgi:carbamoyl-phosphate synthase large subunit
MIRLVRQFRSNARRAEDFGKTSRWFYADEGKIRAGAVADGVTCITTMSVALAAVEACKALREREWTVNALQDRFPTK